MNAFKPAAVTADQQRAYDRDGVLILRQCISSDWIVRMRTAIDRVMQHPGSAAVEYTATGAKGRYLGDFFVWMRDPEFRAFALESPLPSLARQVMRSKSVTLFYDHLLVKEPQTAEETPWHQDLPYWPLRGSQILSLWVAFDNVTASSGAMRYLRGSHLSGVMYAPRPFGTNSGFGAFLEQRKLPPAPQPNEQEAGEDLIVCEVEPGDVIVHHPLTLHWSPGNLSKTQRRRALAVRYLGDDAVYDSRPGSFLDRPAIQSLLFEPLQGVDGVALSGPNFPLAQSEK